MLNLEEVVNTTHKIKSRVKKDKSSYISRLRKKNEIKRITIVEQKFAFRSFIKSQILVYLYIPRYKPKI